MIGPMDEQTKARIEPVDPPAAYELVVERIRRAIHLGTYVPGEKLPPERLLAQHLGVSRTTVREAIRVLEGEGYVETRRGATGGLTVRERKLPDARLRQIVRERLGELEELLDFREANECAAARLAALRRTKEDLIRLDRALTAMRENPELDVAQFRAADSAFHLGIADAARNRLLWKAIEDARAAMFLPIDAMAEHVFKTANNHHARILAAIRAGDARRANRAMADHIETTRRDLRTMVSDESGSEAGSA
jgi:GntR family transcriptional repressor for pyruvate dehydrogenase complex